MFVAVSPIHRTLTYFSLLPMELLGGMLVGRIPVVTVRSWRVIVTPVVIVPSATRTTASSGRTIPISGVMLLVPCHRRADVQGDEIVVAGLWPRVALLGETLVATTLRGLVTSTTRALV